MDFIKWVQLKLISHGYNPGVVDGVWGRKTLQATVAFQKSRSLPAQGVLNEATVAALRTEPDGSSPKDSVPKREMFDIFPWMALAMRKKGLHEGRDNIDLRKFLKSDGKTLGDPAKLPWCGDFVETCIAVTLPDAIMPRNPYLARNWLKFGHTVDPCYGSVMVFWRGSRGGTSGHVAFYYSEDSKYYHVLGGNQSNSVSVTGISKNRFLGARLPEVGGPYPRRKVNVTGGNIEISENEW
jgi:uncharacterized protein (TIGR02594 family)